MTSAELLPWIEKYRPECLSDLVAHEDIISTIRKLMQANKLPHLLFYGPPGTGKTSTILALARELYADRNKNMVLELNASDARGIDTVRNQIQTFAGTRTLFGRPSDTVKLIVLDEADNMTRDAQMALRRIIERYSRYTRFCLICNYASKIIPALQSRCTKFRFSPLRNESILSKMNEVCMAETLSISDSAKEAIVTLSGGDMRRVLNLLQSSSLAVKGEIESSHIFAIAGKPTPQELRLVYEKLLNDSFKNNVVLLSNLREKGLALEDIVSGLYPLVARTELSPKTKSYLLQQLSNSERCLSKGVNEKIQQQALVASFVLSRTIAQSEFNDKEVDMDVET